MKIISTVALFLTTFLLFLNLLHNKNDQEMKLNEIQVIGSHNSYKIAIEEPLFNYLLEKNEALEALQYDHIPLSAQLNLGLRGLELDVYHDPEGGHYTNPKGLSIVKAAGKEPIPYDVEKKLEAPGLKMFHVQDVDFRSHQLVFKDALKELKKWSQEHEGHTPVIITINAKDAEVPLTRKPLPFTAEALLTIDEEIREVFEQKSLITPDLITGDFENLEQAVLTKGWPSLKELKNRFLFVLDEGDEKTDAYLSNFSNLHGAVLFVDKEEGNPNAGFKILNDPIKDFNKIEKLVKLGYMVRTRADADTKEARNNDYTRFEKAKASGAQVITTDYYLPSQYFDSDFKIIFDNGGYEKSIQD
ncbi:phosphatidylinositol-specific phospholipase C1-like protein [Flavimarina sp. Hel_I_48]|uniref:phosphatidylinositol-specific phospholipase C1-like protein n=1 Tax=Flavimarina sp. Hel_I_48 TaxID=1392488 RepID=UPI0004DFA873|nr:phosphatidylinositol-specific phospholipase C1-like protein [Flavimarina sp. Hel_I_48]